MGFGKKYWTFASSIFFIFFFLYIYKMYLYLISAEGYKNADVHLLIIKKTGKIWASMKDAGSGMGVKNIWSKRNTQHT